jgi:hypothetical protein
MKKIAKIIFKIHRFIYGIPTKSEVRLAMDGLIHIGGVKWFVCMLYVCDEKVEDICEWMALSEKEVKDYLNQAADEVVL